MHIFQATQPPTGQLSPGALQSRYRPHKIEFIRGHTQGRKIASIKLHFIKYSAL